MPLTKITLIGPKNVAQVISEEFKGTFQVSHEFDFSYLLSLPSSEVPAGIIFDANDWNSKYPEKILATEIASLRESFSRATIIVMGDRINEHTEVALFKAGSDHVMGMIEPIGTKRVSILGERLSATIKRYQNIVCDTDLNVISVKDNPYVVHAHGLTLDQEKHLVSFTREGITKTCLLSATEFSLLYILVKFPDTVFSRTDLKDKAWSRDLDAALYDERAVDSRVKLVRRKLLQAGIPNMIESVYGMGYTLRSPEVSPLIPQSRKNAGFQPSEASLG